MKTYLAIIILVLLATACSAAPVVDANYDPSTLKFEGIRAFEIESEFVTQFPDRASGMPNSSLAVQWLQQEMSHSGWDCQVDSWKTINYSKEVPLNNVVCKMSGVSEQQILVTAHHDQAPTTVQGADNDGSGISILLHLAEIFAEESNLPYTLVFIASDGEEYGMLGTRRFIHTHPDTSKILAGISLDNLGKYFYDGIDMEASGQFRNFGALWLQLLAGETARQAGDLWIPKVRSPLDQVLGQAVPISFMDQGPVVAAGIPAVGFSGLVPADSAELHWDTYHTSEDLLEYQSVDVLQQSGRVAEALIRELLLVKDYPPASSPYLYLEGSQQVLTKIPLYLIWGCFVALFFLGSVIVARTPLSGTFTRWKNVFPHFLGLWLPLVASIILMYLMVAVGLMYRFEAYPATPKDPLIVNPRWLAVIIFILGLGVFFYLGRILVRRFSGEKLTDNRKAIKSFALFVLGLAGIYVLLVNPFSLLFFVPLLFWFLITGRRGAWVLLDILLFLLGGLMVYALFYFFGFVNQRIDFYILYYIMMMFSIMEIGPLSALAIIAVIASGLTMIVPPPKSQTHS